MQTGSRAHIYMHIKFSYKKMHIKFQYNCRRYNRNISTAKGSLKMHI